MLPPPRLSRKQIKTKLMLCKSYTAVQKQSPTVEKVGVAHAQQDFTSNKLQISMQINPVLLYN